MCIVHEIGANVETAVMADASNTSVFEVTLEACVVRFTQNFAVKQYELLNNMNFDLS